MRTRVQKKGAPRASAVRPRWQLRTLISKVTTRNRHAEVKVGQPLVEILVTAISTLIVSMLLAVACVSSGGGTRRADLEAVLSLGFQQVEHGTRVVVAILPSLDPSIQAAVSKLRQVVRRADVPKSEMDELPAGYFVLETVRIAGDAAIFAGRLGPVPRQRPGLMIDDCGTGFRISMNRREGRWFVGPMEIQKC